MPREARTTTPLRGRRGLRPRRPPPRVRRSVGVHLHRTGLPGGTDDGREGGTLLRSFRSTDARAVISAGVGPQPNRVTRRYTLPRRAPPPAHAKSPRRNSARHCPSEASMWSQLGSNQRPFRCERNALPLSYGTSCGTRGNLSPHLPVCATPHVTAVEPVNPGHCGHDRVNRAGTGTTAARHQAPALPGDRPTQRVVWRTGGTGTAPSPLLLIVPSFSATSPKPPRLAALSRTHTVNPPPPPSPARWRTRSVLSTPATGSVDRPPVSRGE